MPPSRREELVESAMKVFGCNGFHNTGLDLILKDSGISRMTLYNHFKSKDELIIAALRRRDETFRNNLMKFVESSTQDPAERLLAIFDALDAWFNEENFHGCMFINASAEFCDQDSPPRRVAAEHKLEILRYIQELCASANLVDPEELAQQINLLVEGSIVVAHVVGRVHNNASKPSDAAQRAKVMAKKLIMDAKTY
jgi:AcrR family transcriptional regulator